ncbi:MAG: YIP1 family protein [Tannerellaceae bacterium]|jgi:hypothetical protein|nr:YIP1 family protein [Tannerellaceae bacterium]
MYKNLFRQLIFLLSAPAQAWRDLTEREEKKDDYLTQFVYPLIGLVAASAFVGVFFAERDFQFEHAIKAAIKAIFSSFGGYFLAAYLLNELRKRIFKQQDNLLLCRRFTGYASAGLFALHILFALLPIIPLFDFLFLRIFILFLATLYIAWEGVMPYLQTVEHHRLKLSVAASLLIVLTPEIINRILFILMPGLRS